MPRLLKAIYLDVRSGVPVAIWAFFSAVLAITGPFGTYATMSLDQRALFWLAAMALALSVTTVIRAYVVSVLGLQDFKRESLLIAGLVSVVLAPPLYGLPFLFDTMPEVHPGFLEIVVLVASASLGVCSLRKSFSSEPIAVIEPTVPKIIQRLDLHAHGRLMSLSVRDHYVDVRTHSGMSSVLMRLSDAIAEAEPVHGVQVHRSHWVAWDAIDRVQQDGPKTVLYLHDGLQVPVSRANVAKLEERGIL